MFRLKVTKSIEQASDQMDPYSAEIEKQMQKFYGTLSEKDKRRYAAVEALKIGHGGITYIATVLGCAQSTISLGIAQLKALPDETEYQARIRRPGGGRKSFEESLPEIDTAFLTVLEDNTAGDPMQLNVRWTNLSHEEIAHRLSEEHGLTVSETVVKQLLKKHNFTRRKIQKKER